jgi:UDP-glucose 4-epimerase
VIYGDGKNTRDYTYVGDVVDGIIAVMNRGIKGVEYNLCSSEETSVIEMMDMISDEMGVARDYDWQPARPADVMRHCGGNVRAGIRLRWKPVVPLKEAVRRAVHD